MDTELLVESDPLQTRVAVVESGRLAELLIERRGRRGQVGNLYKGRVRRALPGMRAAFVDLGLARDGYLWIEDGLPRRGQDLIVQVTKDGLAGKGVRITTQITLPGRYLVLTPTADRVGVSKRIVDADERDRLKRLASAVCDDNSPAPGCIVRTAATGAAEEQIRADYEALLEVWRRLEERAAAAPAPTLLHREDELDLRVTRDLFSAGFGALLVDGADAYRRIAEYLERVQPQLVERVERTRRGLFERYRIDDQVEAALRDRAPLPSGGYLVINQTEALVAIDVNTGRDVGSADFEETILRTNLEAVAEAVRQIRLRDLSGILVIDLIDMEREDHRERVFVRLEAELKKDRARHRVLDISEFGLVQLTRRRSHANLEKLLTRDCPYCRGAGRIKSVATICLELRRTCLARARGGATQLAVRVHPEVLDGLRGAESAVLDGLQGAFEAPVIVQAAPEFHREHFVVDELAGERT